MNCNRCGKEIHFDDSLKSPSGKKIPLQGATGYDKHDCPNNPFKKTQNEFTNTLNKLEEKPIISNNTIIELIKENISKVDKMIQIFEAILINQGLYKPASDLEQ